VRSDETGTAGDEDVARGPRCGVRVQWNCPFSGMEFEDWESEAGG
jgi:hypothetical protein